MCFSQGPDTTTTTTTTTNEASEIFLDEAVHHECRIVLWRTPFQKAGLMFTLSLIDGIPFAHL